MTFGEQWNTKWVYNQISRVAFEKTKIFAEMAFKIGLCLVAYKFQI